MKYIDIFNFFDGIRHRVSRQYYNLKYGIKNLVKWFPIIWKDRNWDYEYIFPILRKKLVLLEKGIRKYTTAVDRADVIKEVIELIDFITTDDEVILEEKFFNITGKKLYDENHTYWVKEENESLYWHLLTDSKIYVEKQNALYKLSGIIGENLFSWWW